MLRARKLIISYNHFERVHHFILAVRHIHVFKKRAIKNELSVMQKLPKTFLKKPHEYISFVLELENNILKHYQ